MLFSGTHGYMAPEVLSKGTGYDSSADWFSFGCMLYKLLKGHSPFRQHKTKDKHEIDRMTLTMVKLSISIFCIFFNCTTTHTLFMRLYHMSTFFWNDLKTCSGGTFNSQINHGFSLGLPYFAPSARYFEVSNIDNR